MNPDSTPPTTNDLVGNAPTPLTLKGNLFLCRQPTDADFLTLRSELKRQASLRLKTPLQAIMNDLDKLPEKYRDQAIQKAIEVQAGNPNNEPTDAAIANQLFEPEGCRFWVWLLLRKEHPELLLSSVAKLIDPEDVPTVLAMLKESSGLAALGKNSNGGTGSNP